MPLQEELMRTREE